MSLQPIYGGPAYVLRNVGLNIPDEQIKLKSLGGTDLPSGVLVWHNTWVSPEIALNLQTPIEQFHFRIENNLFVGPETPASRTVEWTAIVTDAVFDYDGYYPDDGYWFGRVGGANRSYATLAEAQAAGVEVNGVVLSLPIFEDAFVGPAGDGTARSDPGRFGLAAGSNAIDRGRDIEGINSRHAGAGPDLGAWERGCAEPVYGPRALGMEASFTHVDCDGAGPMPGTDAGMGVDAGSVPGVDGGGMPGIDAGVDPPASGGCGCRADARRLASAPLLGLALLVVVLRFRRR
jgi:hypothetical protein